ncbi:hypothetical protein YC2023_012262 [Brassica napus]
MTLTGKGKTWMFMNQRWLTNEKVDVVEAREERHARRSFRQFNDKFVTLLEFSPEK